MKQRSLLAGGAVFLALAALGLGGAGSTAKNPRRANDPIPSLVAQVSGENIRTAIQALQGFQTRYATTAGCAAAGDYLLGYFASLGVSCAAEPFTYGAGLVSRNIVATLPGRTYPDRIVILCAHYDSTSNDRTNLAPGADDDASGVAAVMEAARILKSAALDFTVRCICFSAEEGYGGGSAAYAQAARQRGERIVGVIDLDMIAYADLAPEDLDIIVNYSSRWLLDGFLEFGNRYTALPFRTIEGNYELSDYALFWRQNYSAICLIEDFDPNDPRLVTNPHFHKTTDTLETLDLTFASEATKAAIAAAAGLAQPLSDPPTPPGLKAFNQRHGSLFWSATSVRLRWDSVPGAVGYNVYRTTASHRGYRKMTTTPIVQIEWSDLFFNPSLTYYYIVRAVDAQGRESNATPEVRDDEDNGQIR